MRYAIVLDPEPDGSAWNVTVPALPGCFTWGETPEAAIANAREAIAGHVAALRDLGRPIPPGDAGPDAPLTLAVDIDAAAPVPVGTTA
jgi:antitoxin HicB